MSIKKQILVIVFLPFILIGCMPYMFWQISHDNEMVMSQGMSIQVKNKTGTICIEALDDLTRKYYWNGNIKQSKMWYRNKRWFGKYGAYSPGGRSDVHIVVEEGQYHFYSQQEAEEWLMFQDPKKNFIFTKDGLTVGWYNAKKDGYPEILLVDVIQIYILGKKPVDLSNAQDSLFTVAYSNDYEDKVKIGKFQPNAPKTIDQRMYSGKSIDIMVEKGITAKQVEHCIKKGEILDECDKNSNLKRGDFVSYIYTKRSGDVLWVTLDKDNRVVLVGK